MSVEQTLILAALSLAVLARALEHALEQRARRSRGELQGASPPNERRAAAAMPSPEPLPLHPNAGGVVASVEPPLATGARAAVDRERRLASSRGTAVATPDHPPEVRAHSEVRSALSQPKRLREVLRVMAVLEPARGRLSDCRAVDRATLGRQRFARRR